MSLRERFKALNATAPARAKEPEFFLPVADEPLNPQRALEDAAAEEPVSAPGRLAQLEPQARPRPDAPQARPEGDRSALARLKERVTASLYQQMSLRLNEANLTDVQLNAMVVEGLTEALEGEGLALTAAERRRLLDEVIAELIGHGPIEPLLNDPEVSEVMVNGAHQVYVERRGRLEKTAIRFQDDEHVRRIIDRIVSRIGRRIDESSPLVDARLPDGSRVNAVIPPLAVNGSALTIRKFSKEGLNVHDLIRLGTLSPDATELLEACVRARLNIIVSGGTGSGKTTMLNVVSAFIPDAERIVSIEDAVELQLQQEHVVRLESRPANVEGKGEVTIRELVRNSLRMRPDRIIVGEVRGAEALDMLQAMNTGHDGSLSTVHANSPRDAMSRLETLVLMAGMDLPLRVVREQISSAVNLIVQMARLRDGTRRVTAISEVHGMEGQVVTLQDVFVFDFSAGVDANGRFRGQLIPTGVRPKFAEKFEELGIPYVFRAFQRQGMR